MASSDPYRLGRDVIASTRLNLQHYIWKENIGYLLHPSIQLSGDNISIADVGTGTGIWLLDLYRQYPNAELHGFDITSEQYPAPGFLPPNVTLSHLNILQDIPAEYVEKYDVVHARLLVQVVLQAGGDPRPVIQNLMKLIKPGGYLQWEEPNDDAGNRPLVKSDPATISEHSEDLMKRIDTRFRSKTPIWSVHLAETLTEQGLQQVLRDEFSPDTYTLILDQMNYLGLFGELISKVPGEENQVFRELLEKAVVEARGGVAWKVRRFVFVGRK
ncbi:S-adenosyl-L-methionine-dependent methyltransferase, partial [Aspergillus sclerotiicarbonarius CBS 121057]